MLTDKHINAFKEIALKQLSDMKPSMSDIRFRIYEALIQNTDNIEDIRDLADLEYQCNMNEYFNKINSKLKLTNTNIDELHKAIDTKYDKSKIAIIDADSTPFYKYDSQSLRDDMDDPEVEEMAATILAYRLSKMSLEELATKQDEDDLILDDSVAELEDEIEKAYEEEQRQEEEEFDKMLDSDIDSSMYDDSIVYGDDENEDDANESIDDIFSSSDIIDDSIYDDNELFNEEELDNEITENIVDDIDSLDDEQLFSNDEDSSDDEYIVDSIDDDSIFDDESEYEDDFVDEDNNDNIDDIQFEEIDDTDIFEDTEDIDSEDALDALDNIDDSIFGDELDEEISETDQFADATDELESMFDDDEDEDIDDNIDPLASLDSISDELFADDISDIDESEYEYDKPKDNSIFSASELQSINNKQTKIIKNTSQIFLNGTDRGKQTQKMYSAISKIFGGIFNKKVSKHG